MATWSFRDALEELELKRQFDDSMLKSEAGLRVGDVRFAELQATIRMRTVQLSTFLHYVEDGAFNPDHLAPHHCSQTTAILLTFLPGRHLQDIEYVGIGCVIHRSGAPVGDVSSIGTALKSIRSVLESEGDKQHPHRRAYMMLITNYGGHMAFAMEPPYCVAYMAEYQDKNPSRMTPRDPENHWYVTVSEKMIVRRLLSVPNWDPLERKHIMGGRLLIPRGVQFGPRLFPELVVPRNHAGPPIDPATGHDAPLRTVGSFRNVDPIFPSFPGDLALFTAKEGTQLKELGILTPLPAPERLSLFPPLVASSRGRVVSAALGAPPLETQTEGMKQSLMTDQDEESVLSDSYSDRHSSTANTSIVWERYLWHSSEQKPRSAERPGKDSGRSNDKDRDKNRDGEREKSRKGDIRHGSDRARGHSPRRRDHDDEHSSTNKRRHSHGQDSSLSDHKVKQRRGTSASPPRGERRAHTPECQPLLPPPTLHSTPLVVSLKPASVESVPARLSFNRSQCSLPPLDLGEEDAHSLPSVGVPTPAATSSVAGPIPQTSTPASTLQLTADHTKTIFNLACEGRHLKERIAWEFLKLSSREVLFHTQAQSTSHEALVSMRPERFSALYQILWSDEEPPDVRDKAMEEIVDAANKAWSRANETLFQHVIDYEEKLNTFLTKVGGWIREQEERIWTIIFQIVEDTGAPVCAFLNILFRLLDTLPSLPPNLSYQSQSPLTCGFSPAAYAQPWLGLHNLNLPHTPSFDGGRRARDVLKEAIIRSSQGRPVSKVRVIPAASTSTAPKAIPSRDLPACSSPAVHSPSKRKRARSPSPQQSQSGTSSSGSLASGRRSRGSRSSSSSSSGSSSGTGSGSRSRSGSPARSEASAGARSVRSAVVSVGSVEVLSGDQASEGEHDASYSTDEVDVSQGSIPLLDISASDNDETRKCKARDYARRSDTAYAVWKEKQTSDGVKGMEEWDQTVNDYTDGKRRPKNPDPLSPPVSYMEDRGVFQPLTSPTNILGYVTFTARTPTCLYP